MIIPARRQCRRLPQRGTAGEPVTTLMIHDWGKLVLKDADGHVLWSTDRAPKRWDGWNIVSDGHRLRRGQTLRNASLVSDNDAYAFVVGEEDAASLSRTDGPVLWVATVRRGEGYQLTPEGRLVTRTADGLEHNAYSLHFTDEAAAELAARNATELLVTDDGQLVLVDDTGAVIWTMTPPLTRRQEMEPRRAGTPQRKKRPKATVPADLPPLPVGEDLPVVRTDFTDDAWAATVARVSREYHWVGGDTVQADVTPIDDPRYAGLTAQQAAALVPADADWPMLVLADAVTMASPKRHLLMVNLDEDGRGQSARATTGAVVEIAINLWIANMDWVDYVGDADQLTDIPEDIIDAWNIAEDEAEEDGEDGA